MIMQRRTLTGSPIALEGRERFEDRMRRITERSLRAASMKVTEMNPESARWYCLLVKKGREFDVENSLREANVEAFMPRERVVKVRHGRKIEGDIPYFPSYMLVRCIPSPEAFHGLRRHRNVLDIVGGASGYHALKDENVAVFKRICDGAEVPRIATDKSSRKAIGRTSSLVLLPVSLHRNSGEVVAAGQGKRPHRRAGAPFDIDSMPLAFLKKL